METKWQIGPVKLANGDEAFIDAINEGQEDWRYVGRVQYLPGLWIACGWHASGRLMHASASNPAMYAETDHKCNLAHPPKKTARVQEMWVAVLHNGEAYYYYSQQAAKNATYGTAVFAIKKIEPFEVTEGEGL
jgi:hypothetical protein